MDCVLVLHICPYSELTIRYIKSHNIDGAPNIKVHETAALFLGSAQKCTHTYLG